MSIKSVLVGCAENYMGCRILKKESKNVMISKDVRFIEDFHLPNKDDEQNKEINITKNTEEIH